MKAFRHTGWWISAVVVLNATSLAVAQRREDRPPASESRPARPRDFGEHGRMRHRFGQLGPGLFQVTPEDQGPLKEGEAEDLLEFAREHAPRLHRLLAGLQRRNPERFRERMEVFAPRLRHLRRVYERDPHLGEILREHAENTVEIERAARDLRGRSPDTPNYQNDVDAIRPLVADNVQREAGALEILASDLESRRDPRITQRVAALLDESADLAEEPETLRDLVGSYQAAKAEPDRERLRAKIRAAVTTQADDEIAAMREKSARMREHATEEVDRRMERLLTRR